MTTPTVWLVEGADGVGKSTFAQRTAELERTRGGKATIVHNGPPGDITKLYDLYLLQIKRAIDRRDNHGESTIIDRSFLSEAIYGAFRGGSKLSKRQVRRLERFCRRNKVILLGIDADVNTRRERIQSRGEAFTLNDIWTGVKYRTYFRERDAFWITAGSTPATAPTESN